MMIGVVSPTQTITHAGSAPTQKSSLSTNKFIIDKARSVPCQDGKCGECAREYENATTVLICDCVCHDKIGEGDHR